jgi:hypothetical protein
MDKNIFVFFPKRKALTFIKCECTFKGDGYEIVPCPASKDYYKYSICDDLAKQNLLIMIKALSGNSFAAPCKIYKVYLQSSTGENFRVYELPSTSQIFEKNPSINVVYSPKPDLFGAYPFPDFNVKAYPDREPEYKYVPPKKEPEPEKVLVRLTSYEILGAPKSIGHDDLKKLYKLMMLIWHPDKCKDRNAEEKTKEIIGAYNRIITSNGWD